MDDPRSDKASSKNAAERVHLATGLALRDGRILLVASRYPNHEEPLWNLPGGRQRLGELLTETVVREVSEETGLSAKVNSLAYVSESYDGDVHFLNFTFDVELDCSNSPVDSARPFDLPQRDGDGDHVVAIEWVAMEELPSRIVVGVVREPLLAYLRGELRQRYAGFHEAGITIEWPDDPG